MKHNFTVPLQQQQKFFMAKFNSIWGEMELTSKVDPVPKDDKKEEEAKAAKVLENTEDEEDEGDVDSEEIEATITPKTESKKEEEEEEEEEEAITYEADDVNKAFNMLLDEGVIEVEDDELENFEATTSGIADLVAASVRKKLQTEIDATPPAVQALYRHIMAGNSEDTFKFEKPIVWAEANEEDEEVQKASLRALYASQEMTAEEIEEEIEDVIASDKLAKKASIAISTLAKREEKQVETQKAQAAKVQAENEKKQQEEIDRITSMIDEAKEFAGFELDDKRKEGFKEYLLKVQPRTGKTQLQMNMASEERKLRIAFLDFIDYNKEDLEKGVETKLTKTRKKKLSRFTDKNVSNKNSSKSVTTKVNKSGGSIKFPTIFGSKEIELED